MKKKLAWLTTLVLLCLICTSVAFAEGAGTQTLRDGKYVIGRDITAGKYEFTCTGTEGEQMSGLMSGLGEAYDSIEGVDGMGALFGAFGGLMEEYDVMTIEILGDFGDVLRSYEMKAGESMTIALEEGTALEISDGSCTIKPAE